MPFLLVVLIFYVFWRIAKWRRQQERERIAELQARVQFLETILAEMSHRGRTIDLPTSAAYKPRQDNYPVSSG